MSHTPREVVTRCLTFQHPGRIPRHLWTVPWALERYPAAFGELRDRFPDDICHAEDVYRPSPRLQGNPYAKGVFTDEWGCVFMNIQEGARGEVCTPLIEDLGAWEQVNPPGEILPRDTRAARDRVNRFCSRTDLFVLACCCPRPWERYQFLRGTQNALIDIATPGEETLGLLRRIHEFYLEELEFWVSTDVDAIMFMDDWGAQDRLLIPPDTWREVFKPLYRDYCDLARGRGKHAFMHSDGHIAAIYEDLVEVGVNAINSQLFCMDMSDLARRVKGRITFWGEIDRQHVLPSPDPRRGREAVREVAKHLHDPSGGIIAQFEYGLGINPETAIAVFDEWDRVSRHRSPPSS